MGLASDAIVILATVLRSLTALTLVSADAVTVLAHFTMLSLEYLQVTELDQKYLSRLGQFFSRSSPPLITFHISFSPTARVLDEIIEIFQHLDKLEMLTVRWLNEEHVRAFGAGLVGGMLPSLRSLRISSHEKPLGVPEENPIWGN